MMMAMKATTIEFKAACNAIKGKHEKGGCLYCFFMMLLGERWFVAESSWFFVLFFFLCFSGGSHIQPSVYSSVHIFYCPHIHDPLYLWPLLSRIDCDFLNLYAILAKVWERYI